ncbi:MAG: hypothetical protein SGPRY_011533, partial [Prymnesium sp.]
AAVERGASDREVVEGERVEREQLRGAELEQLIRKAEQPAGRAGLLLGEGE